MSFKIIIFSTVLIEGFEYTHSGAINCTIGLGFTLLITCIVSMFLIEKVGRKMLLMASFGGMFFISICLSITMILTVRQNLDGTTTSTFPSSKVPTLVTKSPTSRSSSSSFTSSCLLSVLPPFRGSSQRSFATTSPGPCRYPSPPLPIGSSILS
jgi:hypothetical protein